MVGGERSLQLSKFIKNLYYGIENMEHNNLYIRRMKQQLSIQTMYNSKICNAMAIYLSSLQKYLQNFNIRKLKTLLNLNSRNYYLSQFKMKSSLSLSILSLYPYHFIHKIYIMYCYSESYIIIST